MAGISLDDLPSVETLEGRFNFIKNANLRQNVTVCFQYVIFLTLAEEYLSPGGTIQLSIYRDVVVHTASIIESCLHYALTELVSKGELESASLSAEWTIKETTPIHEVSPTEKIIWGKKIKETKALKSNPASRDINNAAKVASILNDELFAKAESLREMRNNIHIIGADKNVTYPTKKEINDAFEDARKILKRIEERLS